MFVGRDSVVGVATGYGVDGLGIESLWGQGFFAPMQISPGPHPAPSVMRKVFLSQG